jgi:mannitol/fructose-specific phosphotransferase system IIA component (Ntr-type)
MDGATIRTRDQAFEAMLAGLADGGHLGTANLAELRDALIRRDELGPTGIGDGVAIPHAWHPGLTHLVGALATLSDGIEYPSLDDQPVRIILMILTPPSRAVESLKHRLFETCLARLRDPSFRAEILSATSPDQLRSIAQTVEIPAK